MIIDGYVFSSFEFIVSHIETINDYDIGPFELILLMIIKYMWKVVIHISNLVKIFKDLSSFGFTSSRGKKSTGCG